MSPLCDILLTVGWLVLCSNALNLIDGIDGLAAGVGTTVAATMLIAGLLNGDLPLALATAPLAGALAGFLAYNFSPASIFLGDSGSLLIGFLLGVFGIIWTQNTHTIRGIAAPAMALALPLLEVVLSIVRRFLRNEPIFVGDRGHIHHRLLDRGFTPRDAALLLYAVCSFGAFLSLLQSMTRNLAAGAVMMLFAVASGLGVRYLGYTEFEVAARFLRRGFRPTVSAHVHLKSLERAIGRAEGLDQCWEALAQAAKALGYDHLTARLGGDTYSTAPHRSKDDTFWQMRLNLPDGDYVNITQDEASSAQPVLVVPFIASVRSVLPLKLSQLAEPLSEANLVTSIEIGQRLSRNSSTRTVISSDCAAPSVNAATAS